MQKEIYDRYSELRKKRDELEAEIKTIEKMVLGDMKANGIEKFQHDAGTFSNVVTTKYAFSEDLLKRKKEVEDIVNAEIAPLEESIANVREKYLAPFEAEMELEKENGKAAKTETVGLRFQAKK